MVTVVGLCLATWWVEKTVDFSRLRVGTGEAVTVLKINEPLGVGGRAGCIGQLEDVNFEFCLLHGSIP